MQLSRRKAEQGEEVTADDTNVDEREEEEKEKERTQPLVNYKRGTSGDDLPIRQLSSKDGDLCPISD